MKNPHGARTPRLGSAQYGNAVFSYKEKQRFGFWGTRASARRLRLVMSALFCTVIAVAAQRDIFGACSGRRATTAAPRHGAGGAKGEGKKPAQSLRANRAGAHRNRAPGY